MCSVNYQVSFFAIFLKFVKVIYFSTLMHIAVRIMAKSNRNECCKIDAVVTVDAKGQIVLPKDLRERADIKPNDKLAIIEVQRSEAVCCIVMMKADALGDTVKCMLGPIFKGVFENQGET